MLAILYTHTFVFECPACNLPIAVARISEEKNLETTDGQIHKTRCSYCGWTGDQVGFDARDHYVVEWPRKSSDVESRKNCPPAGGPIDDLSTAT
jgi:hypothetical protein